eukprot:1542314-Prymnesium_polylepis.1
MDRAGMDATEDFEDVGHSNSARVTLQQYEIGELPPSERSKEDRAVGSGSGGAGGIVALLAVAVAVG